MSNQLVFFTNFSEGKLDSDVSWYCPPAQFQIDTETNRLVIKTDAKTDFWQRTHYGFEADNGHFLYREVEGDFEIMTKVHTYPVNRYDQAGLMIRVSKDTWIKTSVEYNPDGPNQLGAVVTNQGFSDWSSQNFTQNKSALYFKIQRKMMITPFVIQVMEIPGLSSESLTYCTHPKNLFKLGFTLVVLKEKDMRPNLIL